MNVKFSDCLDAVWLGACEMEILMVRIDESLLRSRQRSSTLKTIGMVSGFLAVLLGLIVVSGAYRERQNPDAQEYCEQ